MSIFLRSMVLLWAMLLALACWAGPIQISPRVQVEVVQSLSPVELWNSAPPQSIETANIVVESRQFDSEARPRRDRWFGCAIVMVGTSDLGIRPVALRVWTDKSCEISINISGPSDSRSSAEFDLKTSGKDSFKIIVTSELKVLLDGHLLGKVED